MSNKTRVGRVLIWVTPEGTLSAKIEGNLSPTEIIFGFEYIKLQILSKQQKPIIEGMRDLTKELSA